MPPKGGGILATIRLLKSGQGSTRPSIVLPGAPGQGIPPDPGGIRGVSAATSTPQPDDAEVERRFALILDRIATNPEQRAAISKLTIQSKWVLVEQTELKDQDGAAGAGAESRKANPAFVIPRLKGANFSLENLQSVRVLLRGEPKEWVDKFLELDGLKVLAEILNDKSRAYSQSKEIPIILHECMECIRAIMDWPEGLVQVLRTEDPPVIRWMMFSLGEQAQLRTRILTFQLLYLLAYISSRQGSVEPILDALQFFSEKARDTRPFAFLVRIFSQFDDLNLKTNILTLVNTLLNAIPSLSDRVHFRDKFIALELDKRIQKKLEELPKDAAPDQGAVAGVPDEFDPSKFRVQADIFLEQLQDDLQDLDELYGVSVDIGSNPAVFASLLQLTQREDTCVHAMHRFLLNTLALIKSKDTDYDTRIWPMLDILMAEVRACLCPEVSRLFRAPGPVVEPGDSGVPAAERPPTPPDKVVEREALKQSILEILDELRELDPVLIRIMQHQKSIRNLKRQIAETEAEMDLSGKLQATERALQERQQHVVQLESDIRARQMQLQDLAGKLDAQKLDLSRARAELERPVVLEPDVAPAPPALDGGHAAAESVTSLEPVVGPVQQRAAGNASDTVPQLLASAVYLFAQLADASVLDKSATRELLARRLQNAFAELRKITQTGSGGGGSSSVSTASGTAAASPTTSDPSRIPYPPPPLPDWAPDSVAAQAAKDAAAMEAAMGGGGGAGGGPDARIPQPPPPLPDWAPDSVVAQAAQDAAAAEGASAGRRGAATRAARKPKPKLPPKPKLETAVPHRQFRWARIKDMQCAGTFWETANDRGVPLDTAALDKLFAKNQPAKRTGSARPGGAAGASPRAQLGKKQPEKTMLDAKTLQNTSIAIHRLGISQFSLILAHMASMNWEWLAPDVLKVLTSTQPDDELRAKFVAFKGQISEYGRADQYYYVLVQIPRLKQRLQAMDFYYQFPSDFAAIQDVPSRIRTATRKIREAPLLPKVLELILAVGNYLNAGDKRLERAYGFRPSSLKALLDTKTTTSRTTLLRVLVEITIDRPALQNLECWDEELDGVLAGTRTLRLEVLEGEYAELDKSLTLIKNELDRLAPKSPAPGPAGANSAGGGGAAAAAGRGRKGVGTGQAKAKTNANVPTLDGQPDRFGEVFTAFYAERSRQLQGLRAELDAAKDEFGKLVQYYGEDPKRVEMVEFFGYFGQFADRWKRTRLAVREDRAKQARAAARQRAAGRSGRGQIDRSAQGPLGRRRFGQRGRGIGGLGALVAARALSAQQARPTISGAESLTSSTQRGIVDALTQDLATGAAFRGRRRRQRGPAGVDSISSLGSLASDVSVETPGDSSSHGPPSLPSGRGSPSRGPAISKKPQARVGRRWPPPQSRPWPRGAAGPRRPR